MMPVVSEPAGDIAAQLRATLDPGHPKRACFCVPADAHVIPRTLAAYIVDRPEGTLVTLQKQLADAFEHSADDVTLAWILGYPEPKPTVFLRCCSRPEIRARVVQARDADNHVVSEAIASPVGFWETVEVIERHVPRNGCLVIVSPRMAIMRRVAMRWVEA
jgi:hypothetical protein